MHRRVSESFLKRSKPLTQQYSRRSRSGFPMEATCEPSSFYSFDLNRSELFAVNRTTSLDSFLRFDTLESFSSFCFWADFNFWLYIASKFDNLWAALREGSEALRQRLADYWAYEIHRSAGKVAGSHPPLHVWTTVLGLIYGRCVVSELNFGAPFSNESTALGHIGLVSS